MAVPRAAFVALADSATGRLRLEAVNDAFVSLTGWLRERAAGAAFPPPQAPPDLADRLAAAVRQGRAVKFELEWPGGADGAMRIEFDLMPAGDGTWLGFVEDVTAERRAFQLLAASEARYRGAAESGSDWVWETDAEHRLSWLSPHYFALEPARASRLFGKRRWETSPDPPDANCWRLHRADLDARRPFRDFQFRSVDGDDGGPRYVRVSGKPVFAAGGKFVGYRGVGRDVTEEVAARRLAQLSEARLDAAIESINEGFALFDADDRLVRANRKLLELAQENAGLFTPGAAYADILRAVAARGVLHDAPVEIEKFLAERLAVHRNLPSETEYRTAGGLWLKITETRTADGGVAMVYRNVTHLKRAEETLRKAAEEAEAANQAKSEFLANMSHELRTPLNAIIGFAEIIGNEMLGPIGNARYAAYAKDIRASGAHLLEVINQVLDMSKIEAGRFDLNEEELDVAEVLAGSARLLENMAAEGGIALSVDVPDPPPGLVADRRALRQVVLNLLGNAIKFTPRGGCVELSARAEPNGGLAIAVRDTGIGIAQADIATALAPFGQIDNPMTRGKPGTGLGLPIVKALVEMHGGSLSLQSEPGKGTTVAARFPARRITGAQSAKATA